MTLLAELAGVLALSRVAHTDGSCPAALVVSLASVQKLLNTPRAAAALRIVDAVIVRAMQQLREVYDDSVVSIVVGTGRAPVFSAEAVSAAFAAVRPVLRQVCVQHGMLR